MNCSVFRMHMTTSAKVSEMSRVSAAVILLLSAISRSPNKDTEYNITASIAPSRLSDHGIY
ncbi:hypothetical protein QL093DRAFT_2219262 [Fusarium oxysporum]|nr:hypothetical protein QL093DRAFT_2219262 [Fusarium oxysporum]